MGTFWRLRIAGGSIIICLLAVWAMAAVPPPAASGGNLTLAQAVRRALAYYPTALAAARNAAAAQAQVGVAKTSYLPVMGLTAQFDRATDNAVLGLSFPSPLPSISGTVPPKDYFGDSAWSSAAGLYFNWEFFDFGRRAANVHFYRDLAAQASEQEQYVRLQVAAHAADAFLNVLAAQAQQSVAMADVGRWRTVDQIVRVLVGQQLRPGADASRADAELAGARIQLAGAEQTVLRADAALREAVGGAALPQLDSGLLAAAPEAAPPSGPAAPQHPEALAQQQAVAASQQQGKELAVADRPRFYMLGAAFGRGTGVLAPGQLAGGLNGLSPTGAGNWAVGGAVDFSFTRLAQVRQQRAVQRQQLAAAQDRYTLVLAQLDEVRRQAAADLAAARQVAQESPIELQAAQTGEAQARARYQAGLSDIVDLANAEQLLARAQSDDALSRLQVWRGWLETGYAKGDLQPFLRAVGGY
ncbi:MAG: TolC family protein [Terriglobales bacterium]